jgi:DNA-binding XRE family transcriptional regulator
MLIRDAAALPPLLDGLVLLPDIGSQGSGIVIPPIENSFEGKGLHVPDSAGDNYSRQAASMIPVTANRAPRTMCPMGRGVAPTRFKSEFAERLKAARIAAGYATQQEFANVLGVPIERYKKWESGRTPMPHQYIPAACELTGQDANYFFKVSAKVFKKTA